MALSNENNTTDVAFIGNDVQYDVHVTFKLSLSQFWY